MLADIEGMPKHEQLRILQEYAEQYSLYDNYLKRSEREQRTGFFHESLGFMSRLFDTVYNYIFE